MRATASRSSTTTPAARRCRRRRRSTSRRASCWARSPASSACANILEAQRPHAGRHLRQGRARTRAFERELPDADIVISQPFWPAYLTAERIAKAPKLKLAITAGIGSDHVDLAAAMATRHHGHRGHLQQLDQRRRARRDDDPRAGAQLHPLLPVGDQGRLEHRRLRRALLRRRGHDRRHGRRRADRAGGAEAAEAVRHEAPLHRPPPPAGERSRRNSASPSTRPPPTWCRICDVVTINAPLHPETEDLFNAKMIAHDEARRLSGQHRARQDRQPRRGRRGAARAASWPATPATSGSRSRRRRTTRGGRCPITA